MKLFGLLCALLLLLATAPAKADDTAQAGPRLAQVMAVATASDGGAAKASRISRRFESVAYNFYVSPKSETMMLVTVHEFHSYVDPRVACDVQMSVELGRQPTHAHQWPIALLGEITCSGPGHVARVRRAIRDDLQLFFARVVELSTSPLVPVLPRGPDS